MHNTQETKEKEKDILMGAADILRKSGKVPSETKLVEFVNESYTWTSEAKELFTDVQRTEATKKATRNLVTA